MLIRLHGVEFDNASAGVLYAQPTSTGAFASSRNIVDSTGTLNYVMYNSSYATFQPSLTPTGSGTLVTVFSYYSSGVQLLIRDTTDVQFNRPRF